MKCSAWVSWKLVDDEMVPTETCQRDADVLLSSPPHWFDQPYCQPCAGCVAMWAARCVMPLEEKVSNE